MNMDVITLDIFVYVLAGALIICLLWIIRLERKMKKFMAGKNAKSLEDSILNIKKGLETQRGINADIGHHLEDLDTRLASSVPSSVTSLSEFRMVVLLVIET